MHDLASEFSGLGMGIVHHDRKMGAEDPFDTVSGTQGLVGAADTIWIIKRNASSTTLYVRGRELHVWPLFVPPQSLPAPLPRAIDWALMQQQKMRSLL